MIKSVTFPTIVVYLVLCCNVITLGQIGDPIMGQIPQTINLPNTSAFESAIDAGAKEAAKILGDAVASAFYENRATYAKVAAQKIKEAVERKTEKGYDPDIKTLIYAIDTRPPETKVRWWNPSVEKRSELLVCPRLCWTTIEIIGQLRELGYTNTEEAIPVLISLLDDQDSDPVISKHTPKGSRIDWRYRIKAAEALAKFGPKAKDAIPALTAIISGQNVGPNSAMLESKDPDYWDGKKYSKDELNQILRVELQKTAAEALKKITTNAGEKK